VADLGISLLVPLVVLAVVGFLALVGFLTRRGQREERPVPVRLTCTAIVPAHNEQDGIIETLRALVNQTVPFDEIIVAADDCTDDTVRLCLQYQKVTGAPITVIECSGGSKAKAQNLALPHASTDLVLPVDADTVLAPDYLALINVPFADENVAIAAGCVLTKNSRRMTERGRTLEYLFGFHWHRPIQNKANSPVVCSGCNSAFRRDELTAFGGFPERTIVEDMDYTWSKQIEGRRAVYVGNAVAYAADPEDLTYLRKQVWRWMAGFFQNVRLHFRDLLRHKRMLAVWVALAMWEILTVPLWYAMPFIWLFVLDWSIGVTALWFFGAELALLMPPILYGAIRRKVSILHVIACIPSLYVVKVVNFTYAWKALVVEMVLVPLGVSGGLHYYAKGRADTVPVTAACDGLPSS
jgi:cellulose synthase/poly-beta-1,6-N-acetylglucosamine synthase-like glycosyltransferase